MYTYTPHKAYLWKLLISVLLLGILVFLSTYLPMYFIMQDVGTVNYQVSSLLWSLGTNLLWFIPCFLVMFPLFKTYRYELMDDEIIVTSGYIVQKVRHVPYRMVTNLELRRGLLDRMLGIGSLHIETAGNSESSGRPEAVLAGLSDVQQVYEEVAECLHNYDQNHQGGFGVRTGTRAAAADIDSPALLEAILIELKAIREKV